MMSLTWLLLDLRSFIHENHRSLEFPNRGSSKLPNFTGSRPPELRQFPDSRTSQVPGLLNFASSKTPELRRFQVSWTLPVSRLPNFAGSMSPELRQFPIILKQTADLRTEAHSTIIFAYHRRLAKYMKFMRISSWMLPFHETELSILRLIHEYTYEFSNSDISRVKGFCPIPQHFSRKLCCHRFFSLDLQSSRTKLSEINPAQWI
jgi:hypothetical protein